jgi:hypothetical protein
MDLSALQREISGLESSLDSIEFWLFLSTLAVVVGLLVEYWFPLWELIEALRKRPFPWKLVLEIVGGVLVTIGVAGELWFQSRASKVETTLRSDSHQIEGILNKQAADAQGEAAEARKEAEGFESQIADAERGAEQLRKDAEGERLARVTIEAKVAWRHLTEKQKSEIATSLGDFSNQEGGSFWFEAGDTEAAIFASDIAESLKAAHIVVQPPASMVVMRESGKFGDPIKPPDTGVILQSTKDERSRLLADAIIRELHLLGFDASRRTDPPFDDRPVPQVWINVEPRPEGPQGEYKLQPAETKNNSKTPK